MALHVQSAQVSSYLAAAVETVMGDDNFHNQSAVAVIVLKLAENLSKWMKRPEVHHLAEDFSSFLLSSVKGCVPCNISTKTRERMWSSYHQLRCSSAYKSRWQDIIKQNLGAEGHPIFYQSIGDAILEKVVKEKCPASQSLSSAEEQPSITMQLLLQGFWHISCRVSQGIHLLQKSAHPFKDQLQLGLLDLLDDGDEENGTAEEWLNLIDRGGLKHVNEGSFQAILAMELQLRKHLQPQQPPNFVHEVPNHILKNEDVQFHWSIVASDWEDEETKALLELVVKMWTTIRGFSYASAWVEKFKSACAKSLQKSTGLRKNLITQDSK